MIELYLMIYLKDKDEFDRGNFLLTETLLNLSVCLFLI